MKIKSQDVKIQAIKESLKELFQDSTSHGIPRVIKSKYIFMKTLWVICFLASTGYCSYAVIRILNDFFNYDHVTSVDVYDEIPAKFPVITICNINIFQTNKSIQFFNDFIKSRLFSDDIIESQKFFYLFDYLADFNETIKKSLSYSLNESLIHCEFNMVKCTADDFEWIFHQIYGNCYRYNSGKFANKSTKELVKISNSGNLYGLRLELYLDDSINTQNLIKSYGYHILINNQTDNLRILDGFDIAAGMCTNIVINRYFTCRLGLPYNDCLNNLNTIDAYDSDVYKALIRSNRTYHQQDCLSYCFQKRNIEKCNCYLKSFDSLGSNTMCTTPEQLFCSNTEWNRFILNDILSECSTDCPAECDSISYTTSITQSNYPSKPYFESTLINHSIIRSKYSNNQTITYEDLKSKLIALNVYYDKMGYTVISQQAKIDKFDLVSNIGGLLGLFLGISFLSLVEIVEALFEVFMILFFPTKINSVSK